MKCNNHHYKELSCCRCNKQYGCAYKVKSSYGLKRDLLKDCMKIEWIVPSDQIQTVFQTGGFQQLFGTGFVSYDRGNAPFIVVRFFLRGIQQGADIQVYENSSVAFTYTKFDQISVECPTAGLVNDELDRGCEGQLTIISRFPSYE